MAEDGSAAENGPLGATSEATAGGAMIDAYSIGVSVALDNGVGEGVAAMRRQLATLDRATASSRAGLARLIAAGRPAMEAGPLGPRALAAASRDPRRGLALAPAPRAARKAASATDKGATTHASATRTPRLSVPSISGAGPHKAKAERVRADANAAMAARRHARPADQNAERNAERGAERHAERRLRTAERGHTAPGPLRDARPPLSVPHLAALGRETAAPAPQAGGGAPAPRPGTQRSGTRSDAAAGSVATAGSGGVAPAAPGSMLRGPGGPKASLLAGAPAVAPTAALRPLGAARAPAAPVPPARATVRVTGSDGAAATGDGAGAAPAGGAVYLDGRLVGRWLANHLADAASRAPAAAAGFDPRQSFTWPGAIPS